MDILPLDSFVFIIDSALRPGNGSASTYVDSCQTYDAMTRVCKEWTGIFISQRVRFISAAVLHTPRFYTEGFLLMRALRHMVADDDVSLLTTIGERYDSEIVTPPVQDKKKSHFYSGESVFIPYEKSTMYRNVAIVLQVCYANGTADILVTNVDRDGNGIVVTDFLLSKCTKMPILQGDVVKRTHTSNRFRVLQSDLNVYQGEGHASANFVVCGDMQTRAASFHRMDSIIKCNEHHILPVKGLLRIAEKVASEN